MSTSYSTSNKFLLFPFIMFAIVIAQTGTAQALDLDVRSSRANRLDFSLQLEHTSIDLDNGTSVVELNRERIGIVSIEVPMSGPQFGLLLGYAYADFSSNNIYESIAMDGYYLGVSVLVNVIKYENIALAVQGHYLYQSIDGKEDQAKASLSLDEFSVSALLKYQIQSMGQFYAGVSATSIEGRYRYNGATNVSVDFENEEQQGVLAGFDYYLSRLETIGISYQAGSINGVSLRFRKLF